MQVPHFDLKRQHAELREEVLAACASVLDACDFVGGARLAAFEAEFAAHCGSAHCIGVANGTDALMLALRAVGVEPGDEVVVPAFTFVATAGAVLAVGARPVLADVDDATALLSPEAASRVVTARTRAIIAVHLFGLPCDVEALREAAASARRGGRVPVVEDCAQAHGASLRGRRVGSLGDAGAFSFYPTKNLGALGDGGAVTTGSDAAAEAVRRLSDHGRPSDPARRGEHVVAGVNSRLDALQAAVLTLKLRRLDAWNERRRAIARAYGEALAGRGDIAVQPEPRGAVHVRHLHASRHARRDAFVGALAARGVQARATYPRALHEWPALAHLGCRPGDFPASEAWAREVVSLPVFPELEDAEVRHVADALPAALDAARSGTAA